MPREVNNLVTQGAAAESNNPQNGFEHSVHVTSFTDNSNFVRGVSGSVGFVPAGNAAAVDKSDSAIDSFTAAKETETLTEGNVTSSTDSVSQSTSLFESSFGVTSLDGMGTYDSALGTADNYVSGAESATGSHGFDFASMFNSMFGNMFGMFGMHFGFMSFGSHSFWGGFGMPGMESGEFDFSTDSMGMDGMGMMNGFGFGMMSTMGMSGMMSGFGFGDFFQQAVFKMMTTTVDNTVYPDDTVTGTNAANTLTGGAGNSTIVGGYGGDTISGGAGNDTIFADSQAFATSSVSGLGLWLDATDDSTLTVDGSNKISQWNDKSGNAYHTVQSTGDLQPLWTSTQGEQSVYFDNTTASGTRDYMTGNYAGLGTIFDNSHTIFVVLNANTGATPTSSIVFLSAHQDGDNEEIYYVAPTTGYITVKDDSVNALANDKDYSTAVTQFAFSAEVSATANTIKGYVDGVAKNTGSETNPTTPNQFSLGQEWDLTTASEFYKGHIQEVIIFDSVLSAANHTLVDEYLSYHFGNVLSGLTFGIDTLTGGRGADTFTWTNASNSGVGSGSRDSITDFSTAESDKIDITTLISDSISLGGNVALSSVANQLVWNAEGSNTIVQLDSNGDGTADWEIQLDSFTASSLTSASFLFGDVTGTSGADTLTTASSGYTLNGGSGNDTLIYNNLASITGATAIQGGAGADDILKLGAGFNLDLTAVGNTLITGIERIDLSNSLGNTLTLVAQDVLDISDTTNTVYVDGNASDIISSSGWTQGATADGYVTYTQGTATLIVDSDIQASIA